MKFLLRLSLLAVLLVAAGCDVEGPPVYGGSYGFYGEYPYTYYDQGPFVEPYPYGYYYGDRRHWHPFDRDHYFDRRFEHGHYFHSAPQNFTPRFQGHPAPRTGEHDVRH